MLVPILLAGALAAPVTLPSLTVRPDPLEPRVVQPATLRAVPALPPPPLEVHLRDPGRVTMLLSTVDRPPRRLGPVEPVGPGPRCELRVTVLADGRAVRPEVLSCTRARWARRRARDLSFEPARYAGRPVAVAAVPVTFGLR